MKLSPRYALVREKFGSVAACADAIGMSYNAMLKAIHTGRCQRRFAERLRASGIDVETALPANAAKNNRVDNIIAAFKGGCTYQKIGDSYGITRERVRQILKRHGITGDDGGSSVVAVKNKRDITMARDARYMARVGMSFADYRRICGQASKPYRYQKRSAKQRGIEWKLTFADWWRIWQESGKWAQRGRGAGKYCLARISDSGPYAVGNVYVTTCEENGREYQRTKRGNSKTVVTGVYMLLPGTAKPYHVKVGRKSLGYFSTPESAIAARQQYIGVNPIKTKRGFSVMRAGDKFQLYMSIGGGKYKYVARFPSREVAESRGYELLAKVPQ